MKATDMQAAAQALVAFMRAQIPLASAMDIQLGAYDEQHLLLTAPLGPNVNDKGCAFGGSLVSIMTLSGWALVELALRLNGEDCDVFVGDSSVHYLSPVWSDLRVIAEQGETAGWSTFFETLRNRGRSRIDISCHVAGDGNAPAATLKARFVAKRRS